ncbi:MAG: hypothetical protein OEZ48_12905 [Candidatus Bathyarchaeota archaeon]|nr:hypothetical protein [Candidatus Bathyarchaeota archaeon]MDH5688745.1 hypothetical protein [Candidatus Bathyarchaeota archaeon]
MSAGERPSRKRYGRPGPPLGYPNDQKHYADPENWKYPVHTPHHAMAARRYFNRESNRRAYDLEEQLYIDSKINQALRRFGIDPSSIPMTSSGIAARGPVVDKPPTNVETASRDECLKFLLGDARLRRAKAIRDDELTILLRDEQLKARVRDYIVNIDFRRKVIAHDCADWRRRKTAKRLCKHVGKILLAISEEKAQVLLRDLISNPDYWSLV